MFGNIHEHNNQSPRNREAFVRVLITVAVWSLIGVQVGVSWFLHTFVASIASLVILEILRFVNCAGDRRKVVLWLRFTIKARRKLIILAFLSVGCGLLWIYTSTPYVIWDGGFNLIVHVSSDEGPLSAVSCEAESSRKYAELKFQHLLPPERGGWSATAKPFTGKPVKIFIPVSGTESMSGRALTRTQFELLVVIGEFQDGRRVGKLVEIPDGRVSHELQISLP
ncbi:MAG: hypothetical protein JSS02_18005 [Planctomycetes bacterium]|nr:hypothetical protein [Planctomycetota bacterium]